MHIHANQLNLNAQMYALSAAKAEAKEAAERTRKKLVDFASELRGEVDGETDCVMRLSRDGEPPDHSNQREGEGELGDEMQNKQADEEDNPFSGWA
jgi:hypothetical protein